MVTWKTTTFKQRLIRLLDSWSHRLRGYTRKTQYIDTIDNVSYSLVSRCPYCGVDDWDKPKTKSDGSVCTHPTRLRVVK